MDENIQNGFVLSVIAKHLHGMYDITQHLHITDPHPVCALLIYTPMYNLKHARMLSCSSTISVMRGDEIAIFSRLPDDSEESCSLQLGLPTFFEQLDNWLHYITNKGSNLWQS